MIRFSEMEYRRPDMEALKALVEEATRKVPGVSTATVNFMTQKMIVEFAEGAEPKTVMKEVLKVCRKVEPDCEIEL